MRSEIGALLSQLGHTAADVDQDGGIVPPPDFDEQAYLLDNPDVAAAVNSGSVANGFLHFHFYGRHEGRTRPTRRLK